MNRPEVSNKSKYWISKHRYYELKHFCLQYDEWIDELSRFNAWPQTADHKAFEDLSNDIRPVESIVLRRQILQDRISMIQKAADIADPILGKYVLEGATRLLSYEHLLARYDIPCSKDLYYSVYRRFFWILSDMHK